MEKTILETWLAESEENRRLFAEEGLILEVSEEIWRTLKEEGLTKAQLADALGVKRPNVSRLLDGSRNMTLRTLAQIAFALKREVEVRLRDEHAADWEWDGVYAVMSGRKPVAHFGEIDAANSDWTPPRRIAA